jgi:[calcium/calmodulin-dependent protein kinase] kinase
VVPEPESNRLQETFNARSEYSNSEDDGSAQHRINQYWVKQEIGRGSFGAVHLAEDQYGQEYVRMPIFQTING